MLESEFVAWLALAMSLAFIFVLPLMDGGEAPAPIRRKRRR